MSTYTPDGNAANWLETVYPAELDVLCYEKAVGYTQARKLPRPGDVLVIPRFDNLSSVVISETLAAEDGLTYVGNAETKFTASARSRVTPMQVTWPVLKRMAMDPQDEFRQAIEKSVVSGIDSDFFSLAGSLTTNIVGDPLADLDFATLAEAHQKLVVGAKEYYEPGGKSKAVCVVAGTQDDALISISQITNAQIRGDRLNPLVTGWVATAFGVDFYESTNIQVSGGQANNIMFVPRFGGVGFNIDPTVMDVQKFQIWMRFICLSDYVFGTIRDQYAVQVRSIGT